MSFVCLHPFLSPPSSFSPLLPFPFLSFFSLYCLPSLFSIIIIWGLFSVLFLASPKRLNIQKISPLQGTQCVCAVKAKCLMAALCMTIRECSFQSVLNSTVYRGVLSGGWNREVPLYTEMFSFQGIGRVVPIYRGHLRISGCWNNVVPPYTEVFSFHEIRRESFHYIEGISERLNTGVLISGCWNRMVPQVSSFHPICWCKSIFFSDSLKGECGANTSKKY